MTGTKRVELIRLTTLVSVDDATRIKAKLAAKGMTVSQFLREVIKNTLKK